MNFFNVFNNVKNKIMGFDPHFVRPSDMFMRDYFNSQSNVVGVEIGVMSGGHADSLLHHLNIKKLYLVDPFTHYTSFNEYPDMNHRYNSFLKKLESFDGDVEFLRKKSEDAIDSIPKNLDFVYIDGNHSYDFVLRDCELYFSKLRHGGVLCGHDFDCDHLDVVNAVLDFANKNNLVLNGIRSDWWLVKK